MASAPAQADCSLLLSSEHSHAQVICGLPKLVARTSCTANCVWFGCIRMLVDGHQHMTALFAFSTVTAIVRFISGVLRYQRHSL